MKSLPFLLLLVVACVFGRNGYGQFRSEYGKDTILIKKDNKTIEGITVKHKKEGLWISYNEEGRITSRGNYVNGIQEGMWTNWEFRSANDTLIRIGTYSNG